MTTVVAHSVRSGIAALNVVTAALDTDPRTRDVELVFARGREELCAAIASARGTAIVAWSFYSVDAVRAAEELAWLRGNAGLALHVAGGVHATAETAATLVAGFDVVIAGEGEAAFVELVANVDAGRDPRGGPGTAWIEAGSLRMGPAAARHPLDAFPACNLRHGRWNPLEITRGCVYACSFCQTPFMFKARFRHRSVDNVREHVRAMTAEAQDRPPYVRYVTPTSLSYGSPDTSVNLAAVEELLAGVRAELPAGGKQYFGTFPSEVRPEHVSPEALALIKRYADNTSLVIGGQSGSERLLAATHRGHDVASIERAVALCVDAAIRPDVDFLFGLPGETDEDRRATVALAERIAARGARVHAHTFMPLPGTPLANATPTVIAADLAEAVARLESKGAAYGQWRKQADVAHELVQLRRARPHIPRG
ncbi:MAG: TIGR04013 family B12-binding domain/radical SAM domain-containing protein [Kofleriaceae bacterium]|nr:TIGR04013 family B12-binding domain/radical SAM domain-containing protein [Kofleriaceae bacterium]